MLSDIAPQTEQDVFADAEQELERRFKVFIHNDEVTPYDFVVIILQKIFERTPLEAEHITFVAHNSGIAYVATYPKADAQKRVGKAHFAASLEGYPLMFTLEPE